MTEVEELKASMLAGTPAVQAFLDDTLQGFESYHSLGEALQAAYSELTAVKVRCNQMAIELAELKAAKVR